MLRERAEKGLIDLQLVSPDYQSRLKHELSVIHQMGFDDYFLIVGDLLRFARKNQIYCGMGRGSAAGSLVAFALQITHVDPVKNHLFLNDFSIQNVLPCQILISICRMIEGLNYWHI